MKKAKKLVIGNWKMNPESVGEAKKIASDIKKELRNIKKTETVLCPPFVYLSSLSGIPSSTLFLGAQDAFYETVGAYTGEVSFYQLPQFKISFVIVGHSERRNRGETDDVVNKKVKAIVGDGMTTVLCVGEKTRDTQGEYLSVVKSQLMLGLRDVSKKSLDHLVIAYEPVWAIGASRAMNPREIHEMTIFIKKTLMDMYGSLAEGVRILYGGSVDSTNASDIIRNGFVQGLLVGRQSIQPKNFLEIIRQVDMS